MNLKRPYSTLFNSSNNLEQFQKRIDSDDQLKRYLGEEIANQILVSTTYTAVINDILTALIASKKQQTAFETYKVCTILRQLTVNNSQFIPALYTSYELYAEGYFFMETIGVQYGLSFTNTYFDFFEWEKLAESGQTKIHPKCISQRSKGSNQNYALVDQ